MVAGLQGEMSIGESKYCRIPQHFGNKGYHEIQDNQSNQGKQGYQDIRAIKAIKIISAIRATKAIRAMRAVRADDLVTYDIFL